MCFACNSNTQNTKNDKNTAQEAPADWEITTKVKAKIVADTKLSASSRLVSVTTNNGVVTLSGTVSTAEDRDRLIYLARSVDGVMGVDTQIKISNNP